MRVTIPILLSLLAGCASKPEQQIAPTFDAPPTQVMLGEIPNVHVMDGLYLAGQPSEEDFAQIRAAGIRTIVNLRGVGEVTEFDEETVATDAGLDYVHLPFQGAGALTAEIFDRTRELLNSDRGPIFLHCGSANRVGAVWLPWRVLDQGVSVEQALSEAQEIGLRTPAYTQKALDYIESSR